MRTTAPTFQPPFCPNPDCTHHRDPAGWRYVRSGSYTRQAAPQRIRRFQCTACDRHFSTQTFDTTYYLKRPDVQEPIFHGLVSCGAHRQIARALAVAPSTVQRQASRLGRHCLLAQWQHGCPVPAEDLVLDGLVSFEFSQYWPCEINFLVGAKTHYVYGFTWSQLRRSGRMTAGQKVRRAQLEEGFGRPDRQATRHAIRDLLIHCVPEPADLVIRSDEHAAYPWAYRRVPHRIQAVRVSSRQRRDARNPLFAVNLLDALVRHSSANHKRETLAFAKRVQGALERVAVFVAWRNLVKRVSERNARSATPAQLVGRTTRRLGVRDLLVRRLFPSRVELPGPLREVYWRRVPTRQVPNGTRHALRLAA